ncbi:MAG: helix-turn-helix domain-containing protein [bacterium]
MLGFYDALLLFSILQLLLVGVILLFIKSGNTAANRFLSLFLVSKAICFWGGLSWIFGGEEMSLFFFALISYSLDLLLGPSIYFYIKKSTFNEVKFDKYFFAHFIPFSITFLVTGFFCLTQMDLVKSHFFGIRVFDVINIDDFINIIIYTHFVVYSIFSVRLLVNYKEYLKNNYSQAHINLLKWLELLLGGFIIIWAVNIVAIFLKPAGIFGDVLFLITIGGIFLFSNMTVIIAVRYPEIFQNKIPVIKRKYEKTLLQENEKETYLEQLNKLMAEEKVYLSSTLGLADLAEKLKVQNHVVSQLINTGFGKNFYDYVNSYRIEECKKLLGTRTHKSKNILEIAFECGFNSKSVFNDSFKKFTGQTPSDFRKRVRFN